MPFGNAYLRLPEGSLAFFSAPDVNPDTGLNLALDSLGWTAREHVGEKSGSPTGEGRWDFRQEKRVSRQGMRQSVLA